MSSLGFYFTNCYQREFDAVTRARGDDVFRANYVQLELVAARAARLRIQTHPSPQAPSPSHVVVDWSLLQSRNSLRLSCSCEIFQRKQEPCPHIWAALLELDQSKREEIESAKTWLAKTTTAECRLSLDVVSAEVQETLLKDSIDLLQAQSWPYESIYPEAIARFSNFSCGEGRLHLELRFKYGSLEISPASKERELFDRHNRTRIKRSAKNENAFLKPLKGIRALKHLESDYLTRDDVFSLLSPLLDARWNVEFDQKRVAPFSGSDVVLGQYQNGFALAAAFDFQGERRSLQATFNACLHNRNLIPLDEKTIGYLPEAWIKRLELLGRTARFSEQGYLCLSQASLPLLKPILDEIPSLVLDAPAKQVLARLNDLAQTGQAEAPSGLRANLRSYQAEGLFWLEKIAASGYGGILADDMGLGKTVQVIAYLLQRSNTNTATSSTSRQPSLVVVPKSLVFNWLGEIEKFGPRLRVLNFAGSQRGLLRAQDYDVIITTYHVLKNELDRFEKIDFDSIIIDEAQAIKNPHSQVTQAIYRLKGRHRFALTGTPIENSLGDLFSLMRFANPGLIPPSLIKAYGDGRSLAPSKAMLEKLAIAVSPFVLRRTKKQVLTELPDKSEQVLLCELDGTQKRLYDQLRRHYKAALKPGVKSGLRKATSETQMRVFEALLRLRQTACHPGLVAKELAQGSSSKFDVLLEHLDEIRRSGHKALVFSQFTSLLALLKPHLQHAGIKFEYLDGQTHNRGAVVDRFNTDTKTTVFLISLKAGGTGLNLTTASYVFLLDPWWNPAIESQAIDRAYRLGQKQKVMAYRLIAEGTIEQKIMHLQAAKRSLADAVIHEENSFLRGLTEDELMDLF